MTQHSDSYTTAPFPVMRRFALDAGRLGRSRHIVHGLLELDVTQARQYLRDHKATTGESLSFTAFVINCLAKAVEANREVQAWLNWRNQLIIFDDVHVNTMVEVQSNGKKVPIPHIVRSANRKTFRQIHQEIRTTQAQPARTVESRFMRWFLYLPWPLRRLFYWFATKNPQWFRGYSSAVLVTAVGMFGTGGGWGIPVANFSLIVTLGGIAEKPGVVDGRIEIREYLDVTLSFDHDIIDGAPAARFAQQFKQLVESAYELKTPPTSELA